MTSNCLVCDSPMIGRKDKRFCTDSCRSIYHQEQKKSEPELIKKINLKLRNNRRILLTLNPDGKKTVSRELLNSSGFDFKYITHQLSTKKGTVYSFCYDQGYTIIEEKFVLLVRQTEK